MAYKLDLMKLPKRVKGRFWSGGSISVYSPKSRAVKDNARSCELLAPFKAIRIITSITQWTPEIDLWQSITKTSFYKYDVTLSVKGFNVLTWLGYSPQSFSHTLT